MGTGAPPLVRVVLALAVLVPAACGSGPPPAATPSGQGPAETATIRLAVQGMT